MTPNRNNSSERSLIDFSLEIEDDDGDQCAWPRCTNLVPAASPLPYCKTHLRTRLVFTQTSTRGEDDL